MGNNLTPYTFAIGDENIYFLIPHVNFIKREKIKDNDLLKSNEILLIPLNILFQFVENTF